MLGREMIQYRRTGKHQHEDARLEGDYSGRHTPLAANWGWVLRTHSVQVIYRRRYTQDAGTLQLVGMIEECCLGLPNHTRFSLLE